MVRFYGKIEIGIWEKFCDKGKMITCKKHTPFQTLLAVRTFFGLMVGGGLSAFAVAPSITVGPERQSVEAGGTLTLSATASDALGYQWWKDGVALAGATNATLTVAGATVTDSGVYTVAATNATGIAISLPVDAAVGTPSLLAWGDNSYGQLGIGSLTGTNQPVRVANDAVTASVGTYHSLFVRADGTLWAMGAVGEPSEYYNFGQLGIGASAATNVPVFVASNVVSVSAGFVHSLFIKTDGTLWGMGDNLIGELGDGLNEAAAYLPVFVASNVVSASAGSGHSLFVKADGTLWGMGSNYQGQIGCGETSEADWPVCVASNVVSVSAGGGHSLFVKADGSLWGMGGVEDEYFTYSGQLGTGALTGTNVPVYVTNGVLCASAGDAHSLFVTADGALWSMGDNMHGQLGDGTTASAAWPVRVTNGAASAAGSRIHSLFVKTDGTLWAMGNSVYGQLGDGVTDLDSGIPVRPLCGPAVPARGAEGCHALAIGTPLAAVTVSSPRGTAEPAVGTYKVNQDSVITNAMVTPAITNGSTRYVCTGWTATGATPASGSGVTAITTVTNEEASLSWLWRTDYRLAATAGAGGSVDPVSSWVEAWTVAQVTATAEADYLFDGWSGDAFGAENPFPVLMNGSKTIAAAFIPAYTTGDYPTSVLWLRHYGINDTGSVAETADPDGDGVPTWSEYVAGTDPTNALSKLAITQCAEVRENGSGESSGFVITWPSVTGRVYSVKFCTNLADAVWTDLPGAIGLAGESPSMSVTNPVVPAAGSNRFFKVEVNLPQK